MCQKAASGYDMFCRQDFVGIDYGLVDCATWVSVWLAGYMNGSVDLSIVLVERTHRQFNVFSAAE